jgi:hypothetical protein
MSNGTAYRNTHERKMGRASQHEHTGRQARWKSARACSVFLSCELEYIRESFGQEELRVSQQVFASAKLRFVGKYAVSRKHDERANIEKRKGNRRQNKYPISTPSL